MLLDRGSRPLAVQLLGSYVPVYREGETVAVTDRAHVYRLTERITGSDFVDMQRYLRTLDRSKLLGIDATKQMMHDRAEQYAAAVKVLAALNPVKRTERTTGRELAVAADPDPALFASAASQVWMSAQASSYQPYHQATTPDTISVEAYAAQTGEYQGEVLVTWAKGTIHVPVTFLVHPSASTPPPLTAAIVNGASQAPGPLAPGEIFTIFGLRVGPAPMGLQLDSSGKVATSLNGTQVTVDDVAAPLIYVSPGQLNAIVPYETGVSGVARIRVTSNSQVSGAWDVPLAGASPAIFATGAAGVGQGAVLNQDSSVNGVGNAAARGSVIQIFATGGGQTSPAGQTGSVTGSSGGAPLLQVKVTIGGIDAPLQFAEPAPDAVAGLLQVNAVVPRARRPARGSRGAECGRSTVAERRDHRGRVSQAGRVRSYARTRSACALCRGGAHRRRAPTRGQHVFAPQR